MGVYGALLVMIKSLCVLLLTTMPAYGCLVSSTHASGYQKSTKDMLFLACMYGEDYIISTGSWDGFREYMKNKAEYIFPRRQNEDFWRRLYYRGESCARYISQEDGIEIPKEYTIDSPYSL